MKRADEYSGNPDALSVALEEHLAKVQWDRVHHCFGPASDLPDLLRNRASPNETTARTAAEVLWNTVWHQGTVYEASAPAAGALAIMAADPETVDPLDLYSLIAFMAAGRSYVEVHGRGGAEQLAKELEWVRSTRRAVTAAAQGLFESQQEVKGAASLGLALLAAAVPEAGMGFGPTLRRFLREAELPEERQVYATALAALGDSERECVREVKAILEDPRVEEWLSDDSQAQLRRVIRGESMDEREVVPLMSDLTARVVDRAPGQ